MKAKTMKTLCLNPLVAVVDDVFDAELANHAIEFGRGGLKRARVVNRSGGEAKVDDVRTNNAAVINQWADPKLTELAQKISGMVRVPPENAEHAKLLHYVKDQEF